MQTIADMKAELAQMIKTLEAQLGALQKALAALDGLPPEMAAVRLPVPPQGTTTIESEQAQQEEYLFSQLVDSARRPFTQFNKIVQFFLERQNKPVTVIELAKAAGTSRSALTNILYRTQKEAFVSARVPEHRRLKEWSLTPEFFKRMKAINDAERATPKTQPAQG